MALAQSSFEVVSVKRHDPKKLAFIQPACENKRFRVSGLAIPSLFMWAYDLRFDQYLAVESSVPSWARGAMFDIDAIANGQMTPSQCRKFVQQIFVDRFHMKSHWKIVKNSPRYELTVSPKGHKMRPVTPADTGCGVHITSDWGERPCDRYQWPLALKRAISMPDLAKVLSLYTSDRPVTDLTGLTGEYKLNLRFTKQTDNLDSPPLERALLDQLGLVMRLSKGDIELLIIDRLDEPTAN